MMRKFMVCILFVALLGVTVCSAQVAEKLNIYIDKDAILAHDILAEDIRIRPEGMVRVTRHSLWPWDEEGAKWSLFVEIENTSSEKMVIDEDCLIACKANREEIASADHVSRYTTNVLNPGEKVVLHAGAYPYVQGKRNNADVSADVWDVEGLADFATKIRQAEILRVRLEVRGNQSTQPWSAVMIEPKIWIEDRTLHYEWTNTTDETLDFRTIGAVVCDKDGRVIDVIESTHSRGAIAAPDETLCFQKELPPYVTQEMIDCAAFEPYAFAMQKSL